MSLAGVKNVMRAVTTIATSLVALILSHTDASKRRAEFLDNGNAKLQKTEELDMVSFLSITESHFLIDQLQKAIAEDLPKELNDKGDDSVSQQLASYDNLSYKYVYPSLRRGGLAKFIGITPCSDSDWSCFISRFARIPIRELIVDAAAGEYFPWARVTNIIDEQSYVDMVREWKDCLLSQPSEQVVMLLMRIYRRVCKWDAYAAWNIFFGDLGVTLPTHDLVQSIHHMTIQPVLKSMLLLICVQHQPNVKHTMTDVKLPPMMFVHELLAAAMTPQWRGIKYDAAPLSYYITDVVQAVSYATATSDLVLIFFNTLASEIGESLWLLIRSQQYGNGHLESVLVPQTWKALAEVAAYFPATLLLAKNLLPFVKAMDPVVFSRIPNLSSVNLSRVIPLMPPQVFALIDQPIGHLNANAIIPEQMQHYSIKGCSDLAMNCLTPEAFLRVSAEQLFAYLATSQMPLLRVDQWALMSEKLFVALLERSVAPDMTQHSTCNSGLFWKNVMSNLPLMTWRQATLLHQFIQ